MTMLSTYDSTPALSDEASALIATFVAGFESAKTRSNYQANLHAWFCWSDVGGIDCLAAQRTHVETYIRHLEAAGCAPDTICQRIATLSSFYRWAVTEERVAGNPVEGARRPRKATQSTANGLGRHEVTDWLDAVERRGREGMQARGDRAAASHRAGDQPLGRRATLRATAP